MGHVRADCASGEPKRRHHGNRHGRSEQARQAVLEAADDLLVERGFAGVTMEGIAARAGVAKQTVYRWWNTKTDVLMDACLQDLTEELTPPDSGDLVTDLRAYLAALARFLRDSDAGAVVRALIAHAQHDAAFARQFRDRYLEEQRRRDQLPLARARERGQLPAGLDLVAETDQLIGPLYYRVLVTDEPIGAEFTDGLVDALLLRIRVVDTPAGTAPRGG